MKTIKLILFIVEDNLLLGMALEDFLIKRFGDYLKISNFLKWENCLEKIDDKTNIVILKHSPSIGPGFDILKSIEEINSGTEVIMLSEHEDVAGAIESFRSDTKMEVRGIASRKRIAAHVKRILMAPIRIIEKELGLSERLAMFLVTFITIGAVVLFVLRFIK